MHLQEVKDEHASCKYSAGECHSSSGTKGGAYYKRHARQYLRVADALFIVQLIDMNYYSASYGINRKDALKNTLKYNATLGLGVEQAKNICDVRL